MLVRDVDVETFGVPKSQAYNTVNRHSCWPGWEQPQQAAGCCFTRTNMSERWCKEASMTEDDVGALGLLEKHSCSRVILWGGHRPEKTGQALWKRGCRHFSAVSVTSSLLQNKLVDELVLLWLHFGQGLILYMISETRKHNRKVTAVLLCQILCSGKNGRTLFV